MQAAAVAHARPVTEFVIAVTLAGLNVIPWLLPPYTMELRSARVIDWSVEAAPFAASLPTASRRSSTKVRYAREGVRRMTITRVSVPVIAAVLDGTSMPARTYGPYGSLPLDSTRSGLVPVRSLVTVPSCVPPVAASIEPQAEDVR